MGLVQCCDAVTLLKGRHGFVLLSPDNFADLLSPLVHSVSGSSHTSTSLSGCCDSVACSSFLCLMTV